MENKNEKVIKKDQINVKNVNELVSLSKNLLKLLYVIVIIIGIYSVIQICSALKIIPFILSILKTLMPLFIGLVIAWLFYPLVKKLQSKGLKKGYAVSLIYLILIGVILITLFTIIPLMYNQIMELVGQLPSIGNDMQKWISDIFNKLSGIPGLDIEATKLSILEKIGSIGRDLTESLPTRMVSIVSSLFSGIGMLGLSLIIGFFILIGVDHPLEAMTDLLPKKAHNHFIGILESINNSCRSFINGALIDCFVVFVISTIALWIVGLKSPILFGLFCGITNIIPYAGPYIGGAPAVIVGFSQNPLTGILALVAIVLIQGVEGNIFQPMIMSKTTKLHPVTILLGLLIFGHFWGMFGMIIATPVIAAIKAVVNYLDEKFNIFEFLN